MRQISKRIEALERKADKEILADAFPFAIAYHLGGARHESEIVEAYARALGYKDLTEFFKACGDLLRQPPDSVDKFSGIRARAGRAQCQLLAKFGYDLRRPRPAALASAAYRIFKSLPEELLATIRSAHRKSYEAEAQANQLLEEAYKLVEERQHLRHTRRRQDDPRQ
jgi:hypothetical protein